MFVKVYSRTPLIILLISFFFLFCRNLTAEETGPDLTASSSILIDYTTGRVLYEKNADSPIPPASMAKLVTLYLIYDSLEKGLIGREDIMKIDSHNSAKAITAKFPGSSLMGLQSGDIVTVFDLMQGIAVASGNDASYALAEYIAGSPAKFVDMMNRYTLDMGYPGMNFVDPDGWSEKDIITAREYAFFARDYIEAFPQALAELHSVPFIEHHGKRTNTNWLLSRMEGVDGLKTGYIPESGFNFTATAKRKLTRFISVVMGIQAPDFRTGLIKRAEESSVLLEYGFSSYATLYCREKTPIYIDIKKGVENRLQVIPEHYPLFTLSREEADSCLMIVNTEKPLTAPVKKGDIVGSVVFWNEYEKETVLLTAAENMDKLGPVGKLWRYICILFRR